VIADSDNSSINIEGDLNYGSRKYEVPTTMLIKDHNKENNKEDGYISDEEPMNIEMENANQT